MELSKKSIKELKLDEPTDYKLSTLYKYCTNQDIVNAHTADADVKATVDMLTYTQFWNNRKKYIKGINTNRINNIITEETTANNDSDTDSDSDNEDGLGIPNEDDESSTPELVPVRNEKYSLQLWTINNHFDGIDSKTKIMNNFKTEQQDHQLQIGINQHNLEFYLVLTPSTLFSNHGGTSSLTTF